MFDKDDLIVIIIPYTASNFIFHFIKVEATERGIYAGLFVYFLFLFGFAHFIYVSSLGRGSNYHIEYDNFLKHISVGGGVGLFINMVSKKAFNNAIYVSDSVHSLIDCMQVQLWYVQEMILGRVLSLEETEFVYVSILI